MTTKLIIIIIVLSIALSSAVTALTFTSLYGDEISQAKAQEDLHQRLIEWEKTTNEVPDLGNQFGISDSDPRINEIRADCIHADKFSTPLYLDWCKSKGLR